MPMLKAVLFDFNGVIINDEPLQLELFRRVLSEEGISITEEEYLARYLGYDNFKCFRAALTDAGREHLAADLSHVVALIARKTDYYLEAINDRFLLFPGVTKLARAVAAKYPMGIVSGAERKEIEYVLVRAGIRDCFQTIITSADLNSGKPDPEGYLKLLATLNSLNNFAPPILPEECLVIEDSRAGVQAAKNAGMRCLAVTNSYPAEQLAQANWIVAGLEDCDPASLWES
ncbi:MAG TPA: HAD family phosphatase [Blastocatellia bacterium]|nr:HAD family phosphatase [Blastocatellia bacterium]